MDKLLIAVDGSDNSMKAVEYAGRHFSSISGLKITLLHVIPYVPAVFWDDGHILSETERAERTAVVDKWLANRRAVIEPFFAKAVEVLLGKGIRPEQIETKVISDSIDIAGSILEQTHDGGYQTLVMGRRGISRAEYFLAGSITSAVINRGTGAAICIVE